jgi:hypothetical protein
MAIRKRVLEPPPELPTGSGLFRALLVPFDEPIQPPHADAGHRFSWTDVHLPGGTVRSGDRDSRSAVLKERTANPPADEDHFFVASYCIWLCHVGRRVSLASWPSLASSRGQGRLLIRS